MQQDLLDALPNARIRLYAVWFNMYPGDARAKWPSGLLTDSRVVHFWDESRAVGTQYLTQLPAMIERRAPETLPPGGDAMWDAFYVYAAGDQWLDPVPFPLSWGYPIMVTREELLRQIEAQLAK